MSAGQIAFNLNAIPAADNQWEMYLVANKPTTIPSNELVALCQRDNRDAQSKFYIRYRADVTRTLYRILGPDADLEDALQDVFVEVFRSIGRFKGNAKITTWLYRVAVNVALQKLRRRKRRPEGYATPTEEMTLRDGETPLRALQRKESARIVYSVLDTIAPKKRTVFVLHEIMGMNAKEISEIVGANVLTVRTRLHYARKDFYGKVIELDLEAPSE